MWSVRRVINIEGGRRGYGSHLLTFPVTPEAQAIFFRRRHQPRRPPPVNMRPGRLSSVLPWKIPAGATWQSGSEILPVLHLMARSEALPDLPTVGRELILRATWPAQPQTTWL